MGLILGPRGNTLKKMEADTGAKIFVRGRGSTKEGKKGASAPGDDEELHCLITADSEEKVAKALKAVEKIIETAASVPEAQNELKRNQLRELASLNGTLRDDETRTCMNCGGLGHFKNECPEVTSFTNKLICDLCGNRGHIKRDCTMRNNPEALAEMKEKSELLNSEYHNLMREIEGGGSGETDASSGIFSSGPTFSSREKPGPREEVKMFHVPKVYTMGQKWEKKLSHGVKVSLMIIFSLQPLPFSYPVA